MIPRRFEPVLFVLFLSGIMSFVVSGVATWRAVGLAPGFGNLRMSGWLAAWAVAMPIALVAAPLSRRIVQKLVA